MSATTTVLERGIFVDGAVEPVAGETLTITNPATGEIVGRATKADAAAVDRAVRSAPTAEKGPKTSFRRLPGITSR